MSQKSKVESQKKHSGKKRNIKLILEFDGTDFHGWQTQNDVRTVQDEVAQAIEKGLKEEAVPEGCSRTDAGVHAAAYCANFFTQSPYPPETIMNIINSHLPDDVCAVKAYEADSGFHARHSVVSKTYRYSISACSRYHPLKRRYFWHVPSLLDTDVMCQASRFFEGEHDFTAFSGKLEKDKSPVRTIECFSVEKSGDDIFLEVTGRSFLYRMVRIMAGTLVDAGTGRISADEVKTILGSREKNKSRAAAPAHGLCLVRVEYGSQL